MPNISISIDTSKFKQAVLFAFENTRKDLVDIVNRGALVAIIGGKGVQGAMQRTPKASASVIRDVDASIIAAVVRRKHKGEKLTKEQLTRLIRKEYARRIRAIGYTANVGWNNAAIAFGGTGIGGRAKGKGYAEMGRGQRATNSTIVSAEFTNTAPAAALIGQSALQAAVDDSARDMTEYAQRKMEETWSKASK